MLDPKRNPIAIRYGLIGGWLLGILLWLGLCVTLGGLGDFRLLLIAPLVGLPWGFVGMIAGALCALLETYWILWATLLGTIGGAAYVIATSPFDGWLVLTMPLHAFGGACTGLVVGLAAYTLLSFLTFFRHRSRDPDDAADWE